MMEILSSLQVQLSCFVKKKKNAELVNNLDRFRSGRLFLRQSLYSQLPTKLYIPSIFSLLTLEENCSRPSLSENLLIDRLTRISSSFFNTKFNSKFHSILIKFINFANNQKLYFDNPKTICHISPVIYCSKKLNKKKNTAREAKKKSVRISQSSHSCQSVNIERRAKREKKNIVELPEGRGRANEGYKVEVTLNRSTSRTLRMAGDADKGEGRCVCVYKRSGVALAPVTGKDLGHGTGLRALAPTRPLIHYITLLLYTSPSVVRVHLHARARIASQYTTTTTFPFAFVKLQIYLYI